MKTFACLVCISTDVLVINNALSRLDWRAADTLCLSNNIYG